MAEVYGLRTGEGQWVTADRTGRFGWSERVEDAHRWPSREIARQVRDLLKLVPTGQVADLEIVDLSDSQT